MLIAIAAILSTVVIGIPAVLAVDRTARGGTLAGLAFLYGTGLVHFVLLGFSLAGVRWSIVPVQCVLLLIAAGLMALSRRRRASEAPLRGARRDGISWLVDAASLVTIALFFWFAAAARVWQWDFWAIWGLKARAFFETGGVDWTFLTRPGNAFTHPDYPLLVTLQYDYLALLAGAWDDRWAGLLTAAFAAALLLVLRHQVALDFSQRVAATVTLAATAYAVTPFVGLADGPLVAAITAALYFGQRWLRGEDAAARHCAILLGLGALTKNEGVAFAVAAAVAFVAVGKWRAALRLWPAAAIAAPWMILRAVHSLETDVASGPLLDRFAAHTGDVKVLATLLASRIAEPWVAMLLLAGAIVAAGALRRWSFSLAAVAIQFAFYVGAYMVSPHPMAWHVTTSWPRISAHLLLPLLVVVMLALAERFELAEDAAHAEARPEL